MARGNGRGRGTRGRGGRGGRGGGGGQSSSNIIDDMDFTIQMFADAQPGSEPKTGRGRGRGGRGGFQSGPKSGAATPNRGRGHGGYDSPRGRGRGRGDFSNPRRGDYGIGASPGGRGRGGRSYTKPGTLSGLLYQERPLLRPIVFVPSVLTKVLFQEEEELIKPGVEDVDDTEQSHVPTADQVSCVFRGNNVDSDSDDEEEEIEEVDFNEVGKLFNSSATTTTKTIRKSKLEDMGIVLAEEQERFTGFYTDPSPAAPSTDVDELAKMMDETLSTTNKDDEVGEFAMQTDDLFCVDVQPTPIPVEMEREHNLMPSALRDADDDDIIVYVAPHPRKSSSHNEEIGDLTPDTVDTSHFTPYVSSAALPAAVASPFKDIPPAPPSQPFSSISFSFSQKPETPGKGSARLQVPPVSTPRQAKAWKRKRGILSKKGKKVAKSSFGAFGAMREEAEMHRDDPRRSERRRGDSDLEWGDTDDEDVSQADEVGIAEIWGAKMTSRLDKGKGKAKEQDGEEGVDSAHGMEVDDELDMDAMRSFVGGLLGNKAGEHVTMWDVFDAEMIRLEDEEEQNGHGTSSEDDTSENESEEDVLAAEEAMMISESLEFDNADSDEDDDQTPKTSFEAKLKLLREKSSSRKHADTSMEDMGDHSDDEDREDLLKRHTTRAENDEGLPEKIQEMPDENEVVLTGEKKNEHFRSVRNGDFEPSEEFSPAKRRKDKGQDLPPHLVEQWEKDRKAKAEYKKARAQARLEATADPMSKKKGGKKGRKAMLAAAKLDPTINVIPNRIIDMVTLVQQIRRFIADVGGVSTMSLPPTNKETRKNIHEMAVAFNLNSLSKGKGDSRYTTLSKTSKTGIRVDEAKIAKIVRRSGGMGARGDSFIYDKPGRGPSSAMSRHREGDEVGKAAPKINQSNIGFRMLAMMGWSEGDRIGVGGLDAPLTAIIKTTKLGLGAAK